jgi:putative FmdB family regulatory protein
MTLYAYKCPTHGNFDVEAPMSETQPQEHCPMCGGLCPKMLTGSLQFAYGKEDFHGPTIGERRAQQLEDFPTAEPVGQRWV